MKSAGHQDTHHWLRDICAQDSLAVTARGDCMSPLIEDGALLSVEQRARYYPGDILVCMTAAGSYQVHRLLGAASWRGQTLLVTRGDNSEKIDGRIRADQVLGRVSGGDCDPQAVAIPLHRRLAALGQFIGFALRRLVPSR